MLFPSEIIRARKPASGNPRQSSQQGYGLGYAFRRFINVNIHAVFLKVASGQLRFPV
jgi:hypothetical protein